MLARVRRRFCRAFPPGTGGPDCARQNKNFDGSGFPNNSTRGEQPGARVLRVLSDLLEPEAKGFTKESGLQEMRKSLRTIRGCWMASRRFRRFTEQRSVSLKEPGRARNYGAGGNPRRLIAWPGQKSRRC